ncbi:MAG: GntR family transcriptional regulator [Ardenticatenaceae bacterium]|nr:GntR family transcriptional regulator [Ardenticatenaceae bacterium]
MPYNGLPRSLSRAYAVEAPPSRSEQADRQIKERIIILKLPPASIINEVALMAELGLGRTPIREAFQRLSWKDLVVILPRRGIYVAEINLNDLRHIFEIRHQLKGSAARFAAERATPEDCTALHKLLADSHELLESGENIALIHLDREFHHRLVQTSHNPFLGDILGRLYSLSLRLWYASLGTVEHLREAVAEHRRVVEAIEVDNGETGEAVMAGHVLGFQRPLEQIINPTILRI